MRHVSLVRCLVVIVRAYIYIFLCCLVAIDSNLQIVVNIPVETPDLTTQASFVFLPQKFCGNPAGVSQKTFVNLKGLPTFYLDS